MNEQRLVEQIRKLTNQANRNNVTRTKAYFTFYKEHPEIHWAYMAHFVSRNTGWNMTDLQGEFLPRLISREKREVFFSFLERNNWLIFQDAYPQLLIYAASKAYGKPLFHLLPLFGVSLFMQLNWSLFWRIKHKKLLAYAQIINEQQYIQQHVMEQKYYQEHVLDTLLFWLQSSLRINYLFFPFFNPEKREIRLAGTVVQRFKQVDERIRVGKRVYTLLFRNEYLRDKLYDWALAKEHTGSRADYWPQLFTSSRPLSKQDYSFHLAGSTLHNGAPPLFSPCLEDVWPDVGQEPPPFKEWFTSPEQIVSLLEDEEVSSFDLTNSYISILNRLELAIVLKERLLI